jgi:hypothetical protein
MVTSFKVNTKTAQVKSKWVADLKKGGERAPTQRRSDPSFFKLRLMILS